MHVMDKQTNIGVSDELERMDDIRAVFERRAARREFPAVKYLVYLQYAALMGTDSQLVDDLIRHGFDELYEKL